MQLSQESRLLILIAAAFLIGVLVLLFNPAYRIPDNLESNARYYPESIVTPAAETPVPEQPNQLLGF